MKDIRIEDILKASEHKEFEAYRKAIGDRPADFLIDCVDTADKDYVDPVASAICKHKIEKQFARLTTIMTIKAFHYGWMAKTEDSL